MLISYLIFSENEAFAVQWLEGLIHLESTVESSWMTSHPHILCIFLSDSQPGSLGQSGNCSSNNDSYANSSILDVRCLRTGLAF